MKKILIWGAGGAYAVHRKILETLKAEGFMEILAIIDNNSTYQNIDGYPVINKMQITQYTYDYVVIAAYDAGIQSIKRDIEELRIDKTILISEFLSADAFKDVLDRDYQNNLERQLTILQRILQASDEEASDYNWMYQRICEYGVYCFTKEWMDYGEVNWTAYGMMQTIEEFTEFCCYISRLKIESAIEIGVFRGRSSYFICAVLARKNRSLIYNLVDICDRLDSFEEYHKILPMMKKQIPSTSDTYKEQRFDFVFIDGDHSYNGAMTDWNYIGKTARKITVFHDVYAHEYDREDGGIVRAWEEILASEKDGEHRIFSKYKNQWMGIGCILF